MEVCIERIILEKLVSHQNSECCNPDFWQICRIGLSRNFAAVNQSQWKFQTLYTLWRLCEEIFKKLVQVISEIYKNWLIDFLQIEAIFSKTNYTTFSHLLIPYYRRDTNFSRHLVLITLQQTMPQREWVERSPTKEINRQSFMYNPPSRR